MCLIKQQLAYIGPYSKSETCEKDKKYFKLFWAYMLFTWETAHNEAETKPPACISHLLGTENIAKGYA
jgi:hypothetical protein